MFIFVILIINPCNIFGKNVLNLQPDLCIRGSYDSKAPKKKTTKETERPDRQLFLFFYSNNFIVYVPLINCKDIYVKLKIKLLLLLL